MRTEEISITTEYIKLEAALKFANLVGSGGEAKQLITAGLVTVDGEICTERGRKLRPGAAVVLDGQVTLLIR